MLSVRLEGPAGQDLRIRHVKDVQLAGLTLKLGEQTPPLVDGGRWQVDGSTYVAIETEAPTQVRFEDDNGLLVTLGPFPRVRFSGGGLRHGHGFGELLASYDDYSHSWYEYLSCKRYSTLVLEAAAKGNGSAEPGHEPRPMTRDH